MGLAKRYFKSKTHKCKAGGVSSSIIPYFYFVQIYFLDLLPVVLKPEIVEAKAKKLRDLGKEYVVNFPLILWLSVVSDAQNVKAPRAVISFCSQEVFRSIWIAVKMGAVWMVIYVL